MRQPIHLGMLYCEALRVSRNQVKLDLKRQGIRLSEFKACEINQLAREFLAANRSELIGRAMTDLVWARLTKLLSDARRTERAKSMSSAVQISGSKVEAQS